jgi:ribosomal protein S18 acetylase RimI-like enzyme
MVPLAVDRLSFHPPGRQRPYKILRWPCGLSPIELAAMPAASHEPISQFRVRPGKLADLAALLELENRSFAADRLSRRSMRHFLASPTAALIVAEAGGELSGYVLVLFPPRAAIARLYSIAVAPQMMGRGLGPLLMAAAERAAVRHGRHAMRLEVHDHNTRAIARYEKSGYRLFGRHRDYYDDYGDALRFEKPLGP